MEQLMVETMAPDKGCEALMPARLAAVAECGVGQRLQMSHHMATWIGGDESGRS